MRMKHGAGILGMELGADEPAVAGDFNNLDQVALGVRPDAFHAILLVFVFVFVVELISMAMTFADLERSVYLGHTAVFAKCAAVCTQAHGTAHIDDGFLFLHHVDDIMRGFGVHLAGVGIFVAQHVAGKFDDHHLHAEAHTEGREVVDARILHSDDFPFDAALSKAGADQNACHT